MAPLVDAASKAADESKSGDGVFGIFIILHCLSVFVNDSQRNIVFLRSSAIAKEQWLPVFLNPSHRTNAEAVALLHV